MRRSLKFALSLALVLLGHAAAHAATVQVAAYRSAPPADRDRVWIAPELYANRLFDWRLAEGRIRCVEGGERRPLRTLHLLTHRVGPSGGFTMSVRAGFEGAPGAGAADAWAGFLVGVGGPDVDYRLSALCHHWPGLDGGRLFVADAHGRAWIRDNGHADGPRGPGARYDASAWPVLASGEPAGDGGSELVLTLSAQPYGGRYTLVFVARAGDGRVLSTATLEDVDPRSLAGGVALVSHRSPAGDGSGFRFEDWQLAGPAVTAHPERTFGPVVSTMYTFSGGVLKLTAQLVPLGLQDPGRATLEVFRGGAWSPVAEARRRADSATATFRVELAEPTEDVPYRVVYEGAAWEGTLRAAPDDGELVLGALSCCDIASAGGKHWNHDHVWFPHAELARHLAVHDPDVLFFAGDQIYEGGLAGIVREPVETACLDYLYHWYRFVWSFRDLMKDRPTVCLPDDHDVYHGNVWGAGGVRAPRAPRFQVDYDRGGYRQPPRFVNAVHATQTSHLPDPDDPTPLDNGISVYYTRFEHGGVSFGIVADRMWKSAPAVVVPEGEVRNGWFQAEGFDPTTRADPPGTVLLGDRQISFLERWAGDWSGGTWMKVLLSQTIFANVATLPADAKGDGVVPGLAYAAPGEYVAGDKLGADCDSNGWPRSARDRALRVVRKGFAFHVAGDQHLPSFTQYGVDDWGDASYAFCVPAIANLWPRRWYPPEPGGRRREGSPRYTGDFHDGFGNKVTVLAVANPMESGVRPAALYDRNPGYGIVRFSRATREITSECWPRWVDPAAPDAAQYPGWPVRVRQEDGYGRAARAFLPEIVVTGLSEPVVQVRDSDSGRVEYTLRIPGDRFRPKVFGDGPYDVGVGEPGTERWRWFERLEPVGEGVQAAIRVEL